MKAKVKNAFVDKSTGKGYNAGSVFEGEASRIDELAGKGFVHEPKKPRSVKKAPVKKAGDS